QVRLRLGRVQRELSGLVRMDAIILAPCGAVTPRACQLLRNPGHRLGVAFGGTEVPGRRKPDGILCESLGEAEISTQGLQDELPRPDGRRASDQTGLTQQEGPHQVGSDLVRCPVASADGVAGTGAREGDAMTLE